jgi:hypothetical protein
MNGTGAMPAGSSAATWSTVAISKNPEPALGVKTADRMSNAIVRPPDPEVMLLYNNVARLRQ